MEDRFGRCNDAKLFKIQNYLNVVVQVNSSIFAYLTKRKSLWDELVALNTFSVCSCACVCEAKEKSIKHNQDIRFLKFLMGLSDTSIGFRSNILSCFPLPNIDQAYALVIEDEK